MSASSFRTSSHTRIGAVLGTALLLSAGKGEAVPTTYHDVYARWREAPEAFWAEAAEAVHWYRTGGTRSSTPRVAPFYRWFRRRRWSTPATTRSTATSRAAAPTRPR